MQRTALWLVPLLALVLYTHFVGLNRGDSDFVPTGRNESAAFYNFHPDEETLIRAALRFTDPLAPPLTAYGALPLYLLKLALAGHAPADIDDAQTAALIFRKARILAAFISLGSLMLLWCIGRRWWAPHPTMLALCLMAMAPLSIQQAHFYTVDGLFTLCSLAALYAILRATRVNTWRNYALAGLLIGCTGAVRLNGLLLGLILVAAHFSSIRDCLKSLTPTTPLAKKIDPLKRPALSALVAALGLAALQPYLIADPDLIWRAESHADFGFSLAIARGTVLQTWTLVDEHTVPYLHYLTTLLPQAAGWPLAIAALAGLLHIAWRGDREKRQLLLWAVLYFALVGGLHSKPIRYLYPLLPLFALFVTDLCHKIPQRRLGLTLGIALALSTTAYGLAFAKIYTHEDSRIQAARWLAEHADGEAIIGLEKGAFTLHKLIDGAHTSDLNMLNLFYTGPYMLCAQRAEYLQQRAQRFDYIALIDANRYRQFTAVPERYPVAASFYRQLTSGALGYEQVARFKHYPALFGIDYHDDHAEPSFLGYDHPAVLVFARRDNLERAFAQWQRQLVQDPHCRDLHLQYIADALNNNDLPRARRLVEDQLDLPLSQPIAELLAIETYRRLDLPILAEKTRRAYALPLLTYLKHAPTLHRIPAASAASLAALGLPDQALAQLKEGASESVFYPLGAMSDMADRYIAVAQQLLAGQHLAHMQQALELSTQLYEKPAAYNALARSAYFSKDYTRARTLWQRSLALDPAQEDIRHTLTQLTTETTP